VAEDKKSAMRRARTRESIGLHDSERMVQWIIARPPSRASSSRQSGARPVTASQRLEAAEDEQSESIGLWSPSTRFIR
jgi:hypothetical protein